MSAHWLFLLGSGLSQKLWLKPKAFRVEGEGGAARAACGRARLQPAAAAFTIGSGGIVQPYLLMPPSRAFVVEKFRRGREEPLFISVCGDTTYFPISFPPV
jgi:hypothetical protein